MESTVVGISNYAIKTWLHIKEKRIHKVHHSFRPVSDDTGTPSPEQIAYTMYRSDCFDRISCSRGVLASRAPTYEDFINVVQVAGEGFNASGHLVEEPGIRLATGYSDGSSFITITQQNGQSREKALETLELMLKEFCKLLTR